MAVEFGTLNDDGTYTRVRAVKQDSIRNCPHTLFIAEHYRDDGTCRCDDEGHKEMIEWGYEWKGDRWI